MKLRIMIKLKSNVIRTKNENKTLYKRAVKSVSQIKKRKRKERRDEKMKSALFGALMLSSQLIRAEDESIDERRWAVCRFMPSGDWTMSEPEIDGFLLMHEGVYDTSPVIKGVLRDNNDVSDDNFIKRRRFNQMKVFKNYSQTCDIGAMDPFY